MEVTATIILPSRIYASIGLETNIYWANIIKSNAPSLLDYNVTCAKGFQNGKFYRYTPVAGEAGNYSWQLDIYFNEVIIATKTITIYVTDTSVTRNVLAVGDSTLGNSLNIITGYNFVGTQVTPPKTIKHEGYPGKKISFFTTEGSPFWFNGAVDFNIYLSVNSIVMAAGDWIIIHLGINDLFSSSNPQLLFNGMVANLRVLINNMQGCISGLRVGICLTICPAISQDAFGDDYKNGNTLFQYVASLHAWQQRLITEFDNDTERGLERHLIGWNAIIDRENNFLMELKNANARNTNKINTYTNVAHPDISGYDQMGDQLLSFLKYRN